MTSTPRRVDPIRGRHSCFLLGGAGTDLLIGFVNQPVRAGNFTTGSARPVLRGTHEIVMTGNGDVANPFDTVAMERDHEEFIVYPPNAADGHSAVVAKTRTARLCFDLTDAPGPFPIEWFRAHDGIAQEEDAVPGGAVVELTVPWQGYDVVMRLVKTSQK